ncbi:MAG: type II toxin-antitoxin system RelE family toxin [bacterium]
MYKDEYHPGVKKDLKQLDKPVVSEIKNFQIPKILQDPSSGYSLSGEFTGIYSHHFRKNNVDYRICYVVDQKEKTVFILMIGKRENLYTILKRRLL